MYQLTLTAEERRAFDWVGGRYESGDVYKLLLDCTELEWDSNENITFNIPEHVAWAIEDVHDPMWPCFADELKEKLNSFLASVI